MVLAGVHLGEQALVGLQVCIILRTNNCSFIDYGLALKNDAAVGGERQIVVLVVAMALFVVAYIIGTQQILEVCLHKILVKSTVGNCGIELQIYISRRVERRCRHLAENVLFQKAHFFEATGSYFVLGAHVHHSGSINFTQLIAQFVAQLGRLRFGQTSHYSVDKQLVKSIDGHKTGIEAVAHSDERGRIGMDWNVERSDELGIVPRTALFVDKTVCFGMGIEIDNNHTCREGKQYFIPYRFFSFHFRLNC